MVDNLQCRLEKGARNLLINCAAVRSGQTLLIVHETENDGYYDPGLAQAVQETAEQLGLATELFGVPLQREVGEPSAALSARMAQADHTVFLARLGDQLRFSEDGAGMNQIISYALDREMLASPFGRVEYQAFESLKQLINQMLAASTEIHVTCPAGTDFKGGPVVFSDTGGDVTRKRFPVSVFAPVPADSFKGRIAQTGFLTGTGSQYYTPYACELKETLFIEFEGTRISGFVGADADTAAARAHYEFVGDKYGIDTYFVHSWHAGIHPGCQYAGTAGENFERWSGGAFGNPRLLHFHTCGAYPPGEISLNLLDPTILIDGVAIWRDGVLHPERVPGGDALLDAFPEMAEVFRNPAREVGQAACGRLTFR